MFGYLHTTVLLDLCTIECRVVSVAIQDCCYGCPFFFFFFPTWMEVNQLPAFALSKSLHALRTGQVVNECIASEVLPYDCTFCIWGYVIVAATVFICVWRKFTRGFYSNHSCCRMHSLHRREFKSAVMAALDWTLAFSASSQRPQAVQGSKCLLSVMCALATFLENFFSIRAPYT